MADNSTASAAETITVTVRDRSAEAPWGVGLTNPVTRKVVISAFCPVDGQRRGEPRGLNSCDDGAHYWVQVWANPCGHTDMYEAVIAEAAALAAQGGRPVSGTAAELARLEGGPGNTPN